MQKKKKIAYVGVIPGKIDKSGKPFRTNPSTNPYIAIMQNHCEINGGYNRYFFIEERYIVTNEDGTERVGNIKKIHHFNRDLQTQTPACIQKPVKRLKL